MLTATSSLLALEITLPTQMVNGGEAQLQIPGRRTARIVSILAEPKVDVALSRVEIMIIPRIVWEGIWLL